MRITVASVLVSLAVVSEISAAMISSRPHNMLVRRMTRQKRCLQRTNSPQGANSHSSSAAAAPSPSPSPAADTGNHDNHNSGGGNTGTIQADNNNCGGPNASPTPTNDNGPNGSEYWLTCGVTDNGWNPPPLTKYNVKYVDLGSVINTPLFSACAQHLDAFNSAAGQTGLPAILLASIAMQESSCNQYARGPNGEFGLMQLTGEKCPQNGDCLDAYTNISIGAHYLSNTIDSVGGNLALAMGMYNGWHVGITLAESNGRSTCGQRSNMDYLQNVFNGFMQGVNPSDLNMGVFFNTRC